MLFVWFSFFLREYYIMIRAYLEQYGYFRLFSGFNFNFTSNIKIYFIKMEIAWKYIG